jgi:Skp family chaperone for outer membrane proteins
MKLTEVVIENEAGETSKISRAEYIKAIITEMEVKPYESEEHGTTEAKDVVAHILKAFEGGTDVDDGIKDSYGDLVSRIEEDYNRSSKTASDKKAEAEAAKAAKEAEKKAKAEEEQKKKEALAIARNEFVSKVAEGSNVAAEEFKQEVSKVIESLPEGVTIVAKDGRYGIAFDKEVSKETIGETLGYLMQKENNSSYMANQIQFWIGDTISATTERGLFATAKEAAAHIAEVMSKSTGKTVQPASLDQYKRMAERTPVALRNPYADPTAYLAISSAKAPKKGEKEKDEDFKKRLAAFEEDREALQTLLSTGEVTKRKDIMPKVNEMLIKHGIIQKDDSPTISVMDNLATFFHASWALENLLDVHEEGVIQYKDGDKIISVSKETMEEERDKAVANLTNIFYTSKKNSLNPADYIRGYVTTEKEIKVGKDGDGKDIKQMQKIKNLVYPIPFFKQEEEAKPEEQTEAEAPAETPAKKGKK